MALTGNWTRRMYVRNEKEITRLIYATGEACLSGSATLDSGFSRRNTVMRALHRVTGVIRGYQSDSSSKQRTWSVASSSRKSHEEVEMPCR